MRKRMYLVFLIIVIITIKTTFGTDGDKVKPAAASHKKQGFKERIKRSFNDDSRQYNEKSIVHDTGFNDSDDKYDNERDQRQDGIDKELPFWGTRGRRDSSSTESIVENEYPVTATKNKYANLNCKHCHKISQKLNAAINEYSMQRRDDLNSPFWGNRGRRNSGEFEEENYFTSNSQGNRGRRQENDPFWGTRGRRQDDSPFWGNRGRRENAPNLGKQDIVFWTTRGGRDEIEPFWGNRGRREDSEPFWGTRGRREDPEPFWGNRGRREDPEPFWGTRGRRKDSEPFWGNRGRREDSEPFWGNRGRREDPEPFWGNRGRRGDSESFRVNHEGREESEPFWRFSGRREDIEPFWGNRGRRDDTEPFWGNRGRRQESEPFWGNRGRRKESNQIEGYSENTGGEKQNLKDFLQEAIIKVENKIENLSRFRRSNSVTSNTFWGSRSRDSQLKYLFNNARMKLPEHSFINKLTNREKSIKPSRTVLDHRIFVDQPHFILVERSSRSSAEDDPFFISRGKKKFINFELVKAARDRRGVIEELVKSVRNDPFYIARGKKTSYNVKNGNWTILHEELGKVKELICAAIDLITIKNDRNRSKREVNDNEHDRRTILKKLAAQLQNDPYFVSRGKKDDDSVMNEATLEDFINDVAAKCV